MSVHGHWRSGAHYLNALLKLNFNHEDYTTRGHAFPGPWVVRYRSPIFYITRNFDDVAASIWRLRERWGVRADSFEDFLRTRYKDMYHDYGTVKIGFKGKVINAKTAGSVAKIDMTPEAYWLKHTRAWNLYAHPHVHHVDYDKLRAEFQKEMLAIAQYLGSDRAEFVDIEDPQGWFSL